MHCMLYSKMTGIFLIETLMRLAGHLAEKACRIGDEVHLEPMNRHERKIIHMALQDSLRYPE